MYGEFRYASYITAYVNICIAILSSEILVKNCLVHYDDIFPFIIFLTSALDEIVVSINPMKGRHHLNIS